MEKPPWTYPDPASLRVQPVWEALIEAHRHLAELKGLCDSLPNMGLLIDTLAIQEAKDSSEIENIITTHDELYQGREAGSAAAKEVRNYVDALWVGFQAVKKEKLIRLDTVLAVQAAIEQNRAGLRNLPGTVLKNQDGTTVYEPPQHPDDIARLMAELIDFIHADDGLDPLLRMAIAHYQFESIHPFYDGNGRTGRILNLLILQREGLLDVPVLYLSRYVTSTKVDYYRLLRETRINNDWVPWCVYLVKGIAMTARHETQLIKSILALMEATGEQMRRELPKIYRQELLDNLFRIPYTKIEFVERDLDVSRITAAKHLDALAEKGFLRKQKIGRSNFYINQPLFELLSSVSGRR